MALSNVMTENSRTSRAIDFIQNAMTIAACLTLLCIAAVIVANVVLRAFGGSGIRGNIEIVEVLIAVAAFLVLGAAQRDRQHVMITAMTDPFSKEAKQFITRIGMAIALFFAVMAAWECLEIAIRSYNRGESRWGIVSVPVWPARFVVALGYAALALELIRQMFSRIPDDNEHQDFA